LDGTKFIGKYNSDYDDTVQHELAEIIELIDMFAAAHGCNIFDHYEMLKKYRGLSHEI